MCELNKDKWTIYFRVDGDGYEFMSAPAGPKPDYLKDWSAWDLSKTFTHKASFDEATRLFAEMNHLPPLVKPAIKEIEPMSNYDKVLKEITDGVYLGSGQLITLLNHGIDEEEALDILEDLNENSDFSNEVWAYAETLREFLDVGTTPSTISSIIDSFLRNLNNVDEEDLNEKEL
jgi:hypothetical protein